MTGFVALAMGLFRGPEFLLPVLDGGDVDPPEPLDGLERLETGGEDLIAMELTATVGLTTS
jgi:hypothetical protein